MKEILSISEKIIENINKTSETDKAIYSKIVAAINTLIDSLAFLILNEKENIKSILDLIIDEILRDLHISTVLASGDMLKSACVIMRSNMDSIINLIYFMDHPVELFIWAESNNRSESDRSFSQTLEQISNAKYIKFASNTEINTSKLNETREKLKECYRELSERVHGKYKFLQSVNGSETYKTKYFNLALKCLESLIFITYCRVENKNELTDEIPSIEEFL